MDTGKEENTFVTWQAGKPVTLKALRLQHGMIPSVPPPLAPTDWRNLAMARVQAESISYKFIEGGSYSAADVMLEIRNQSKIGLYFLSVQRRAVEITFKLASQP